MTLAKEEKRELQSADEKSGVLGVALRTDLISFSFEEWLKDFF